ncbi:MAG TPA: ParB/Srx family N-terminal domain-containing protein [Bryobacteraceae bacterium]|nr:ParB/Srx family N-terminal domain-containing protein [Bryobacteraceae bacterium]
MTSIAAAKNIEHWPLDKLIPYARNPRRHSDAQVAQIAGSIAEFGFVNPILVDSNAGMVAGHGRLLAARKLGLAEVPVIVLDHLSETQKRAYIIADNRLTLSADWDEEMLSLALLELKDSDFDLIRGSVRPARIQRFGIRPRRNSSWADRTDVRGRRRRTLKVAA